MLNEGVHVDEIDEAFSLIPSIFQRYILSDA